MGELKPMIVRNTDENLYPWKPALQLKESISSAETDHERIRNVLIQHSNTQRQRIKGAFFQMFNEQLEEVMWCELSGALRDCVFALLKNPTDCDADFLNKAVRGPGTNEGLIIEILVSRTNVQIAAIKESYQRQFNSDLTADITSDTSGDFEDILKLLLEGAREEGDTADQDLAQADAQAIYKAGEGKLGTDEAKMTSIFGQRSWTQLQALFEAYQKKYDRDITDALQSEVSGSLLDCYLAIVEFAKDPNTYYATELYKALKGAGTDELRLTWTFVSRSEIDLGNIVEAFEQKYEETLGKWVTDETSGDYRSILLEIIGYGPPTGADADPGEAKDELEGSGA